MRQKVLLEKEGREITPSAHRILEITDLPSFFFFYTEV